MGIIFVLWGITCAGVVFSQAPARLADDFEAGFALWEAQGDFPPAITTAQKESLADSTNATRFVMFPSKDRGVSALELREVFPREDSRLVFYVKTELVPLAQARFSLYVDGKEVFFRQGISGWQRQHIALVAGRHSIRFEVKKTTASFGAGISNAVFLDNIFLAPEPSPPASLNETFDSGVSFGAPDSLWLGSAELIAAAPAALKNDSGFMRLNAPSTAGSSTLEITRVAPVVNSSLSFRFKTEISGAASQSFKLYLDNKEMGSWEGVDMMWRTESIPVPAGIHAVRFEAASKGKSVQGGYNAVFIDDVTLIPDETAFIALAPLGELQTYAESAGAEKIVFTASAYRKDNSLKEKSGARAQNQAAHFSFAVHDALQPDRAAADAEIDENGVFSAHVPGRYTVTASKDGYTVSSGVITVHDADYLFKPFFYSGTGKTYRGFTGGTGSPIPHTPALQIIEPRFLSFEADGFFTLQAKITKPPAKNYAHINVAKIENGRPTLSTYYIVHDSFAERIWLPFGKGEYAVTLTVLETVRLTTPPGGAEGEFRGGSYAAQTLTLTVRNTRDEQGIDGDARWIYPSWR